MKQEIEQVSLNIAVIPDGRVRERAIGMSQIIRDNFQSEFVLNQFNKIPHISIYQGMFPAKNIDKIKDAVRSVSQKTGRIYFSMDGFSVDYGTFLFWNSEKTQEHIDIQMKFIEKINPLREGLVPSVLETLLDIPEEEKRNIKLYGYPAVGERFRPHVTITRAKNPDDARKMLNFLGELKYSFEAKSIILGYSGEHGTVQRIEDEFPLLTLESPAFQR